MIPFTLKRFFYLLLFISLHFTLNAQSLYLKVEGRDAAETKIIDSISYNKVHTDAKSILSTTKLLSSNLYKAGYIENIEAGYLKTNDSTYIYSYSLGPQIKRIHINTGKLSENEKLLLNIATDTIKLSLQEVESFMNTSIALLEMKGYSISTLQLTGHAKKKQHLEASLLVKTEKLRTLDDIVLEGYAKFPEGIRRNILRQYKGKIFNRENLQRVYNDFNALRFVTQPRYPEILFKKDSTKVYTYLQKAKPNTFDGFVGFGNDGGNKIQLTGYLDLLLNNVLNTGEKFNLYWKGDGNKQTTFNTSLELPYVFKSPIGLKASLRIFKQDSIYQNTVTDVNLGYYFNYNSKIYLGRQQTQSVDIQNLSSNTLIDYSTAYWTSTYEFSDYSVDDFLFPQRTSLFLKAGFGNRDSNSGSTSQYFAQANFSRNIYLNRKNIINLKNQTYYLKSDSYIINELYLFGGINSIRGFNENSLQANLYSAIMAEYRYVLAPNMYVYTITDYGYYQDETSGNKNNLLGLGLGLGLLTNNGLFNIIYANGTNGDQSIRLSNSLIHLSFKATF